MVSDIDTGPSDLRFLFLAHADQVQKKTCANPEQHIRDVGGEGSCVHVLDVKYVDHLIQETAQFGGAKTHMHRLYLGRSGSQGALLAKCGEILPDADSSLKPDNRSTMGHNVGNSRDHGFQSYLTDSVLFPGQRWREALYRGHQLRKRLAWQLVCQYLVAQ